MPNWCENKLLLIGDGKDAMSDFKRLESLFNETLKYDSKSGYVDNLLDSIIPIPEVLKDTEESKPYKLPSGDTVWWYQWCTDNWGTKWDAVDCLMFYDPKCGGTMPSNEMRFTFLTAWAPPITWIEKVANIFPNLWIKLEYDEPGMMFRGIASGRGEIVDRDEDYSYELEESDESK